jgi:hypothetical protein
MELLQEFYAENKYEPKWEAFIEQHDLGLPLSFVAVYGLADPTKAGELAVLETWNALCNRLGIDHTQEYATLEEMME